LYFTSYPDDVIKNSSL
jgi:hypothetical protein